MAASESFCRLFDTGDFPPRWLCGNWSDLHGWIHIVADTAIFGAYAAIPSLIAYFVMKRKDVQLPSLWWLFAAFIFSCGFGHLLEAVIFWHPWYRFSGAVKVVTAIVSWATVVVLARNLPALLTLPGLHQLNKKLREEIAAREKTEAEREQFFNLSLDMLCIADMAGRFTRVNPAFSEVLGHTREEMLAKPFIEFVHPEDRAATLHELDGLRSGRATLAFENRYRTNAGNWRWLAWKASVWLDGGLIYATARDITEQKRAQDARAESEQRLAVTLDSIGDGVLATDAGGRVTRMNAVAEKLTGWTSAEALGRPVAEVFSIISEETRLPAVIPVAEVLATGRVVGLANHTALISRDGTEHSIADSAAPIRAGDGPILGTVLVFRDVTDEKTAAEAEALRVQRSLSFHETLLRLRDDKRPDLRTFYRMATEACARALEVRRVGIWLFDPGRRAIVCVEQYDAAGDRSGVGVRLAGIDYPRYFSAIARLDTVVADDAHTHPDTREFFQDAPGLPHEVTSMLDAPVRGGDVLAGLLCCEHTGPRRSWTPDEVRFATTLAGYVMLAIQQDERHRVEVVLRATEEFNRRIIQSLEDQLRVLSLDGRVLRTAGPDHGLTGPLVPSGFEPDWLAFWHEQSREAAAQALAAARRGAATRFQGAGAPDGPSAVWWDVIVSPIDGDDGQPSRLLVVSRDITSQRRNEEAIRHLNANLGHLVAERTAEVAASEERFRLMVEQVQDYAIYMLDCDGRVASWNGGAQRAKGYAAAEILGRHFSCFYTPEDIAAGKPGQMLTLARERGRVADEGWRVRRDGSRFWAEIVVTAIHDEHGVLRGFAKVTHDLTERKKIEAQALRSQRLESIGTLAGGIAHDLNNALAPVLMAIGVLRADHPDSGEMLDVMQTSARRGADMVRQLLTFAKGADGERVALAPRQLVQEIATIVRSTFQKNIVFKTRVPAGLPAILGDATQLQQVLLNLCVNARDAMPAGGQLTLEVATAEVDEAFAGTLNATEAKPGRYVCIRVSDTGTGIPPEILDRIFDPFFTTKDPDKGTGLGLSTALGIVRSHGGFFHVYSQVGRGTTVAAYLPAAFGAGGPAEPAAPGAGFRGNRETILFVDDEAPVRLVARRVLDALNFTPLIATDGTDALIVAAQFRDELHAVITDLHMPHMDGVALVRALRRMLPEVPVIIASGRPDDLDLASEEFAGLGVHRVLPKPFTQEKLAEVLAALPPRELRPHPPKKDIP